MKSTFLSKRFPLREMRRWFLRQRSSSRRILSPLRLSRRRHRPRFWRHIQRHHVQRHRLQRHLLTICFLVGHRVRPSIGSMQMPPARHGSQMQSMPGRILELGFRTWVRVVRVRSYGKCQQRVRSDDRTMRVQKRG